MQIAEQILKDGMAAQSDFMDAITGLIREKKLKNIIETGSYLGMGTTRAISEGLSGDETVYSIEVNPDHYRKAIENNKGSRINFILGLSVGKPQLPIDITFNVPDHIVVDHLDSVRSLRYKQEVSFPVGDNMLDYALSKFDYKPDLVILDSAGHIGLIEFKYLMERVQSPFYLALDDTLHVKHYNTMQLIQNDPSRYAVEFITDQKFGSAIIRVS